MTDNNKQSIPADTIVFICDTPLLTDAEYAQKLASFQTSFLVPAEISKQINFVS